MRYLLTIALAAMSCSLAAQTLNIEPLEVEAGTRSELVVTANGLTDMTTLQFNLMLPEGVTVAGKDAMMDEATNGHTLCVERLAGGDFLFILYSMNLNTFNDGKLLRIPINVSSEVSDGTAMLYTVRFADTNAISYLAEDVVTGIKGITPDSMPGEEEIYNLAGQRVGNGNILTKDNKRLKSGIYIVKGKKVLVK